MQESSDLDAVTAKGERKRRRRKGLQFSSRRALLRSRMVRKHSRSMGANLESTVRTLTYLIASPISLQEDHCVELSEPKLPSLPGGVEFSANCEGVEEDGEEMMNESYVR